VTLESLIRQAAEEGRLDGLTCWRRHDGKYEAGFRARTSGYNGDNGGKNKGWNVSIDADPIVALTGALASVKTTDDGVFG
jgi:hypothetical protein